ncbi:metal ABC transporter solute-binding protein, Zn/Mn family [Clostridium sp. DJ247]|uniref:metal ABC transporter substrate-binding protein n=1 Tax=Clostridium sp. DJ247 TaxID=2726188 RepID=UPI0028BF438B|nr:zinc ABC transporter substrate-binding protein [Clostridium sp. DJ247]
MNSLSKKLIILLCFFIVFLISCGKQVKNKTENTESAKLETKNDVDLAIITPDKLTYYMIKDIVKDKHYVEYMFKNRDSEINFQFSADSLGNVAKKDLFIYMGAGFEPWINDFIDKLNKSKVGVINMSRGVKLLSYNKVIKYKDTVLKDNPFYLLNIDNYKVALVNIKNSIQDRDPKNRDLYEKNFAQALKDIESSQKELKGIRDKLVNYTFIVPEDELSYFTKYNDLKVLDLSKDSNGIITINANANLNLQLKDTKDKIFLYSDEAVLKGNDALIKEYNLKVINIKIYNGEIRYGDIIKYNTESLKKFYESETVKR